MSEQIPLSSESCALDRTAGREATRGVASDIAYQRLVLVNVVFVGPPGAADRGWTLIDAGVAGSASAIRRAAAKRFGFNSRPAAIVLTHGHFDHVGALTTLAEEWDAPIYAHRLEHPYLNGGSAYPPADPTVGGGLMSALSRFYPRGPIDVGSRLRDLPDHGEVPSMPGWRWIATPGHSVGHVSFWREEDRTLIAGDAFVTTGQESAYAVAVQRAEMHGPPAYFTCNWIASRASVEILAKFEPELVVTGHGKPMTGAGMRKALHGLADRFDEVAVPETGRYVDAPVWAEDASAYCRS